MPGIWSRRLGAALLVVCLLLGAAACRETAQVEPPSAPETPLPTLAPRQDPILIASGQTPWRYWDWNLDPAEGQPREAWNKAGYDDGTWQTASGSFGAFNGGDAGDAGRIAPDILLEQYTESGVNIPAYFFRSSFTITDPSEVPSLIGEVLFDDAIIIYINGVPVYANNLPYIAYDQNLAYGCETAYGDPLHSTFTVGDTSMLVAGENTLAVELHQADKTSRDIYFDFLSLKIAEDAGTGVNDIPPSLLDKLYPLSSAAMTMLIGETARDVSLRYYSTEKLDLSLRLSTDSRAPRGGEYPSQYTQYRMSREYIALTGTYAYTASLSKLTPGRDYTYWLCLTDKPNTASKTRTFRLAESGEPLSFFLLGDPQIIEADRSTNLKTLDEVLAAGLSIQPEPSFLISLGDQVNSEDSVLEYDAFARTAAFKRIPLAAICGNHEAGGPFAAYFGPAGMAESNNYSFMRGNALFIALDSNDPDFDRQQQFVRDAIAAKPARWVFVLMHHGLYSAGPHSDSGTIDKLREAYAAFFTEMDIDAVLSGHDHIYARSHLMKDGSPTSANHGETGATLTKRPGETVYLTATSSTGSKHYEIETGDATYLARVDERSEACLTIVSVQYERVEFTTYCADGLSIVDRFTLIKN